MALRRYGLDTHGDWVRTGTASPRRGRERQRADERLSSLIDTYFTNYERAPRSKTKKSNDMEEGGREPG